MSNAAWGSGSEPPPLSATTDPAARGDSGEPTRDASSELLRHVIEETLGVASLAHPVDERDLEALRDVARRHAGATLCLNPVAVDLVRAILAVRWHAAAAAANVSLDDMAWEIAAALMDAPASRARFRQLWLRLGEVVT